LTPAVDLSKTEERIDSGPGGLSVVQEEGEGRGRCGRGGGTPFTNSDAVNRRACAENIDEV